MLSADRWPDEVTFDDLQVRMVCSVCDHKGADVRPDWGSMGSRTLR